MSYPQSLDDGMMWSIVGRFEADPSQIQSSSGKGGFSPDRLTTARSTKFISLEHARDTLGKHLQLAISLRESSSGQRQSC
ncbi:hypothetical protein TNCV_4114031 [Trichonephila clavipes]|nr:hypothetical protein TNCV_4114031 [Trichonephila clavipes]